MSTPFRVHVMLAVWRFHDDQVEVRNDEDALAAQPEPEALEISFAWDGASRALNASLRSWHFGCRSGQSSDATNATTSSQSAAVPATTKSVTKRVVYQHVPAR